MDNAFLMRWVSLQVSFGYSNKPEDYLYRNLDLAVDCDSRVALVGPNGAGRKGRTVWVWCVTCSY